MPEKGDKVLHMEFGEGVVFRIDGGTAYILFVHLGYLLGVPEHSVKLIGGYF